MDKYLVFDGEVANCPRDERGQLDTSSGQVYDLGGWVVDENANCYDEFSLVNEDVFFGLKEAMREAYYADKIPQYMRDIWAHERKCVNTWEMWHTFMDTCRKHDVKAVVAHNIWFDIRTLNATMRYQTKARNGSSSPMVCPLWIQCVWQKKPFVSVPNILNFVKLMGI
jgi:hypothetical protein